MAPLLVAFALGYRWDWSEQQIVKVGAVYIKSYPADAQIYKDDKLQRQRTPDQLINIQPGDNTITVVKENYQSWSKTLEVKPGQTTFIENILLFRNDLAPQKLTTDVQGWLLADDLTKVLLLAGSGRLQQLDANEQRLTDRGQLPPGSLLQAWSADLQGLLFQWQEEWYWQDLSSGQRVNLNELAGLATTKAAFGSHSRQLFLLTGSSLRRLNLNDQSQIIVARQVTDFVSDGQELDLLTSAGNLQRLTVDGQSLADTNFELPASADLLELRSSWLLVRHLQDIWLLRDGQLSQKVTAQGYDWRQDKLLLFNSYESWLFDLKEQALTLIDRSSLEQSLVAWHPSLSYYARRQDGQLQLVELDNRGQKQHVIGVTTANLTNYAFDAKGEKLFFLQDDQLNYIQLQ